MNKPHLEFVELDMDDGWETPEGYPDGIQQKVLASDLDEVNKTVPVYREVETYNVTVSKQMCEKPVAPKFWRYDDVAAHWDRLVLRSTVMESGADIVYQEGPVSAMLAPGDLISRYAAGGSLDEGTLMFGGTLAAIGGVRPTQNFAFELEDPVLGRTLRHRYQTRQLPML